MLSFSNGLSDSRPERLPLGILCTGVAAEEFHYEYIFHVSHPSGCGWTVQKRYSELLELHRKLSARLQDSPPFPPKRTITERLTITDWDAALRRVSALQHYFNLLMLQHDILQFPDVLVAMGGEAPDSVASVRAVPLDSKSGSATATVELQVQPAQQLEGNCRPVEGYVIEVHPLSSLQDWEDGQVKLTKRLHEILQVGGLPYNTEFDLMVRAFNSIGYSPPVTVRVSIPQISTPEDHSACGAAAIDLQCLTRGSRVSAIWAGDGKYYDALVRYTDPQGWVVVDWLRPAPLQRVKFKCVCETGGDDTTHRRIPIRKVRAAGA